MAQIHPTAIVDPRAELAGDVIVGPYCIINGPVRIGAKTIIHAQTQVQGKTEIGSGCVIGPTAFVGLPPQHLKADQEIGRTIIGDRVVLRELVTIHRSTSADRVTRVGDDCFLMAAAHVGHDSVVEAGVIMANAVLLGGHAHIGRKAFLGGSCAIHQFARVGRLAMVAGTEACSQDVPPFACFRYGGLKGYNAIGCRRDGWSQETIRAVRAAFRVLHTMRVMPDAVKKIRETVGECAEVRELLDFIASSKRGIVPSLAQRNMSGRSAGVGGNEEG
jgi:UDP-N-acetylglucosamine acyltransferase